MFITNVAVYFEKKLKPVLEALEILASSCSSVRPPSCVHVRIEKLGFHWTDLDEIWYLVLFENL